MRIALTSTFALATLTAAPAALAQSTNAELDCPPSLDGKVVTCLPANHEDLYQVGDSIKEGFEEIENKAMYDLESDRTYYVANEYVYRVDSSGIVLDVVGTISKETM